MKNLYLFIILSCYAISGYSQGDIILRGKIVTGSQDETSIHIINTTQKTGTTSGPNGSFDIRVKVNDTLLFTAVQYERQEIIVSAEIYREKFLTVVLTEAVNQMGEVNISNIGLTGRLNTDLDQIKTINKYKLGIPLSTKPLPTQQDRRIYTATSSSLDLLLNVLSGRLKQLKKEREISQLMALVRRAGDALPENFFTEYLELSENDIVNFLYFCAENSDLREELSTGNKLALMEYYQGMKKRYTEFITEE
ncbi:MAG TPA: hypothetical protein VLN46_07280 [Gillisia sp.]|nr:hypothetical protein [Gillisia sp.]